MQIKLEELAYQKLAIDSVVQVVETAIKNTFDTSSKEGIYSNYCSLTDKQIEENKATILVKNNLDARDAYLTDDKEITIEMETGTGKTLVYLKTIYELFANYGFTKFIILVPSVAIRQGILSTLTTFEKQLEEIYGFTPRYFEYNSKKLSQVIRFVEEVQPQIMVMTLASFNSEDKILNQAQREDLFGNMPFIEAIGKTNPIIIMDEPQEGMDTTNSIAQIEKLNPLFKLRYSATHKIIKNRLFRLTPYDSYKQNLVKKIEVLTVTERNDEAILKIQINEIENQNGKIKIKLNAWHQNKSGKTEFKSTKWLTEGADLKEVTNNASYLNYTISRISKSLRTQKWTLEFTNGTQITQEQTTNTLQNIWELQIEWLIIRHFTKKQQLQSKGIKCLSLIFIDKVANYMGENPIIKDLFIKKYKEIYPEFHTNQEPTTQHINDLQGYYFAKTGKGEYTDSETTMNSNKEIYDAILKDRQGLLSFGEETANKIEFIFSHSALGVGWDNPNIFNIVTLSNSYSEIKKRQEIGRGLRICVNQKGERVYDKENTSKENRINQLTVIPNESYESFALQYQQEIKEIYGTTSQAAELDHSHKGKTQNQIEVKPNPDKEIQKAFKAFWKALSKKTNYTVAFQENVLIERSIEEVSTIDIKDYQAQVSSQSIEEITEEGIKQDYQGAENYTLKGNFSPLDWIEEISEKTGIGFTTTLKIFEKLTNKDHFIKNPPIFASRAIQTIKHIELQEMVRGLDYHLTGEEFEEYNFENPETLTNDFAELYGTKDWKDYLNTPKKGVFDKIKIDSSKPERFFGLAAEGDPEVVCFLKLPSFYKIPTPIGNYEPDFGIVMKRRSLKTNQEKEFYFVVETKGTDDITNTKSLREAEIYKIKCALKHFQALGVEIKYEAPIHHYQTFKERIDLK